MPAAWDVSRELVDLVAGASLYGCRDRLDAVLLIQHCSVREISLVEFGQKYRLTAGTVSEVAAVSAAVTSDPPENCDLPVTAGGVGDQDEDDSQESEEIEDGAEQAEPLKPIAPAGPSERDEISALLRNPESAGVAPSDPPRADSLGRELVTQQQLEQLYTLCQRTGINKVQAQEIACRKHKLRRIEDMPAELAGKLIASIQTKVRGA